MLPFGNYFNSRSQPLGIYFRLSILYIFLWIILLPSLEPSANIPTNLVCSILLLFTDKSVFFLFICGSRTTKLKSKHAIKGILSVTSEPCTDSTSVKQQQKNNHLWLIKCMLQKWGGGHAQHEEDVSFNWGKKKTSLFAGLLCFRPLLPCLECQNCQKKPETNYFSIVWLAFDLQLTLQTKTKTPCEIEDAPTSPHRP